MLRGFIRLLTVGFLLSGSIAPGVLWGQNYRATITGTVTDPSGAIVPGATVKIHDTDVNQDVVLKTDHAGVYTAGFLRPAQHYTITVSMPGFKTTNLLPILLSTGQVATANATLEVGNATEQITVSDSTGPMLDAQKSDIGTLIDNKTLTEMPLNGRNVFTLATLSAGVNNTDYGEGNAIESDDNLGATSFSVNGGGANQTNVTIDGIPSNSYDFYANGTTVVPVVDAVQEFKLVTSPYDASYGHTGGGVLDVSLKTGTNKIHGAIWEFAKRGWLDANTYYNNANGLARGSHKEDQYGFELDGPVFLPKIYDGRNKTFFMFSTEQFHQVLPSSGYQYDTIDPQWLTGDFSNLYDSYGNQIPIYDPTVYDPNNDYQRTQFQNNQIPTTRLDPVALKILSNYYPAPNLPNNPLINQPWEDVWNDAIPNTDDNHSYLLRVDQILGSKDHLFFEYQRDYDTYTDVAGPGNAQKVGINGDYPYTQLGDTYGLDWVHTLSSNLSTNVHGNYSLYYRKTYTKPNQNFDFTQLGLPAGLAGLINSRTNVATFPVVNLAGVNGSSFINLNRSDYYDLPNATYTIYPNVSWTHGKHTVRFGLDFNDVQYADDYNSTNGLTLNFDGGATQQGWDNSGAPNAGDVSGFSVASMLLGQLGSSYAAQVDVLVVPHYDWHYYAPWVQDDWKVLPKLTLNLGLRWDFVTPPVERHNGINYDFDTSAVNPVSAEIGQTVHGGLTFAGVNGNGRGTWNMDVKDIQPRIGFAYSIYPKTVFRGGFGSFYFSPTDLPQTSGYSYTNTAVTSDDGGRTLIPNNLDNPFPNGIAPAPGNSQGLETNVGNTITFNDRRHTIPYTREFTLGIEQQITSHQTFAINYVGTNGRKLANSNYNGYGVNINSINENLPLFEACDYTIGGNANLCNAAEPNPFYGLTDPAITPSFAQSTTLSAYQLARPYPEFSTVTKALVNNGSSSYNSLQSTYRLQDKVFDVNAAYTWSRLENSGGYIDSRYLTRLHDISGGDVKQRFTLSSVIQVPVGRGKLWLGGVNQITNELIGGWELGSIFTVSTGLPFNLPSGANIIGNLKGGVHPESQPQSYSSGMNVCTEQWYKTDSVTGAGYWELTPNSVTAGCTLGEVAFQVREAFQPVLTQQYTDQIRSPGYYGLDANLAKNFDLTHRINLQLRLELFNVLNHPAFEGSYDNSPGDLAFGLLLKGTVGQSNTPRQGQLAAKITF